MTEEVTANSNHRNGTFYLTYTHWQTLRQALDSDSDTLAIWRVASSYVLINAHLWSGGIKTSLVH